MLYVDYNFMIDETGLRMTDVHPDEILEVERTPLELGDTFVLTTTSEGALYFRKVDNEPQLEFQFE